jgi:hypothetical protein
VAFVYSPQTDTIYLYIGSFSGTKVTGQTDTKDGSGYWAGSAVRRKNSVEETWNTEGDDADFDYTPLPNNPTYHAHWYVYPTTSLSGDGTSTGIRTHSD